MWWSKEVTVTLQDGEAQMVFQWEQKNLESESGH